MSSRAPSGPVPAGAQSPDQADGGLKKGALRFGDVIVLSLASSGPTQSIAVTLAALLATVGGVEIGFGFGFALVGLIISFIVARTGHAPFYTDPRSSHGDHIEEELAAPEPEAEAD
jgi:hypothetical protein